MAASVSLSSTVVASLNTTRSGGFSTAVATGLRPHARLARGGGARFLRRLTQMGRLIEVAHDHFFYPRPRYRTSGGRTSSRRAQSERQDHRGGFPRSHRYRTKTSDTDPRVLRPKRHDYSRGRPAENPGGPTRVIKRRRILKEHTPCGRRRPPRAAARA